MTCKSEDSRKLRDKADSMRRIDHQDATNVDSKGIAFTIRSVGKPRIVNCRRDKH
jgi:hypothetical protein